jgi:hypothetical protein
LLGCLVVWGIENEAMLRKRIQVIAGKEERRAEEVEP